MCIVAGRNVSSYHAAVAALILMSEFCSKIEIEDETVENAAVQK
jgi:hypothetical protein